MWHCPHLPVTHCCCSNRLISAACLAHTSRPAAAGLLMWAYAGTDGQTLYHFLDPALHTMQAVPVKTY